MADEVQATEETSAPAVTDELLKDLEENPEKMRSLDPALRNAVMAHLQSKGDGDEVEAPAPGEEGDKDAKPEDKPAEEVAKSEDETPALTIEQKRGKIRDASNEANRIEQKLKAATARLDKAKKARDEALAEGNEPPEDVYADEEGLKGLYKTVRELRAEVAGLKAGRSDEDEESVTSLQADLDRAKEVGVFAEFEDLQERFPDLATKKPIAEINAQYAKALDATVEVAGLKAQFPDATPQELRAKAIAWYNAADEATRAKVTEPFPEEMDKYGIVLELQARKSTSGGTLRGLYLEMLDEKGILAETVQAGTTKGAVAAARETVKAVNAQGQDIKTLGPGDGHTDGFIKKAGPSKEDAMATLTRLNAKKGWTPAEKAEHKAAMKVLSGED